MAIIDDAGLLCLIVDSGADHRIEGRTRLQKIAYFCQYLDWDIGDYRLHYYGPFSFALTDTAKTAESAGLVEQSGDAPHTFSLTEEGSKFLQKFEEDVCDPGKVADTRSLVTRLSRWSKEELELAATIDFVDRNGPAIRKDDLLDKVGKIKGNFSTDSVRSAHRKWTGLRKSLPGPA